MRWLAATDPVTTDRFSRYVVGLGAALLLVVIVEITVLLAVGSPAVTDGVFLVGVATTVPFLVGIVFGGRWLRTADFTSSRYPRIVGWIFGSSTSFLLINLALIAVMPPESWGIVVGWIRWAVSLGAGVGLLVGCLEARAIERSLAAERAALEAAHLEEQRDYLDYLNSILRHEVLNTATIINGYATLLCQEAASTDQHRRWAQIVIDESDEMSSVIDDVRVLLQSTDGEWPLETVNISRVVTDELRKLEHKWGPLDVKAEIPPDVAVLADGLVARVFGNLLSNAVEHNDAETPTVSVAVDPGPETVRVEIADDGPGIPDSDLDTLFDRVESHDDTHGLGLYLVDRLVTRYGGSVELVETGPDGSVFAVELPAASDDLEEPASASVARSPLEE